MLKRMTRKETKFWKEVYVTVLKAGSPGAAEYASIQADMAIVKLRIAKNRGKR